MKTKIENLCKKYNLGVLIQEPEMITGGLMHKMYRVTTNQGDYAVKVLNPDIMQRKEALQNMINSEKVSNRLKDRIPLVAAKTFDGENVITLDENYYMIFDWLDGKSVFAPDITAYHCEQIGRILGKIHAANITIDTMERHADAKESYQWEYLLQQAKVKNPECYELLQEHFSDIIRWNENVLTGWAEISANQVISHCDLDPKNVMWKENNPYIIDWEAAGYVNPYQELIEVINYWAVDKSGNYNQNFFEALLQAYMENMNLQNVPWDAVLNCSLEGMLGWLEYNVKRALGLSGTNDDDRKKGLKHAKGTFLKLKKLENQMKQLEGWILKYARENNTL